MVKKKGKNKWHTWYNTKNESNWYISQYHFNDCVTVIFKDPHVTSCPHCVFNNIASVLHLQQEIWCNLEMYKWFFTSHSPWTTSTLFITRPHTFQFQSHAKYLTIWISVHVRTSLSGNQHCDFTWGKFLQVYKPP